MNVANNHLLAAFILILLFSWPGMAAAQSDELMRAYKQYQALEKQGRYVEAERFARKALELAEQEFGPEHPTTAAFINNLAGLYYRQGRYADAEPLFKRALAIREKALVPEHPNVAASLNNLAELHRAQGRYGNAEPLFKRSLAIVEKTLGPEHPNVATTINNLAVVYENQGRYGDAEPLHKRALAIREKALGPGHPNVGQSLNNLAELYRAQGRYGDAEPLYKRALAILEKALGPEHPNVAASLNNLAGLYKAQGRYGDALDHIRRASGTHGSRAARSAGGRSSGGLSEQKNVRYVFVKHVQYAWSVAGREPSRLAALTAETFKAAQLAKATGTAAAVAGMGARFAAGDDALSRLVRARQDAAEEWRRLDKKLIGAVGRPSGKRDEAAEKRLRARLAGLDRRSKDLDAGLAREFPEYIELAASRPLPLSEVRELLGPDEAMLAYVTAPNETFLWVVRRERAGMRRLDIGADDLIEAVAELRGGLDLSGVSTLADIPPFDTTRAFELYGKLFAPAEPLLKGARHVFVVADGALQSLPLGVLVTEKPQGGFTDFSGYRQVPWLARKYALTTLPSVSSLRALRHFAKAARGNKLFGGFGDPLLKGHPDERRGIELASLFKPRGIADVDAVRTRLAPLPDTAGELKAMAAILGAANDNLFLGERATERNAKTRDLSDYRVMAFATHGLVAGDLKGLAEPALVLTPPRTGTKEDDGLLTASEVAQLKLNADLVVLSACNTAAADGTPGAEGLSGLAKAFFYAGSRSLLVSHWPVRSDAAVKLTTRMLKEAANDNRIGRAEALRRSMLALMEDAGKPHFAHPMFWAPFVVVGEGGTYAVK
ncbi:MAG TPA: tetratricopeptide repeat protein [Rhodospirillaceae bacterium]|jgi:CHAT domain-containing protein/Flp pilus assembly protein TadD|nr:tetratricopeptide repeat protein [Rhodospirillaceae bacterium]